MQAGAEGEAAILDGSASVVRFLTITYITFLCIEQSVDMTDIRPRDPLTTAIMVNDVSIVKLLISRGADIRVNLCKSKGWLGWFGLSTSAGMSLHRPM